MFKCNKMLQASIQSETINCMKHRYDVCVIITSVHLCGGACLHTFRNRPEADIRCPHRSLSSYFLGQNFTLGLMLSIQLIWLGSGSRNLSICPHPLPNSAGDMDVCDTMLSSEFLSSGSEGCRIITLTFENVPHPQIPNFKSHTEILTNPCSYLILCAMVRFEHVRARRHSY